MDFKTCLKMIYSLIVLISVLSCSQKTTDQDSLQKGELSSSTSYDSIVFRTSSEEYLYLGERLYPSTGSSSTNSGVSANLIAIEGVGDTIFAFLSSEILYNRSNPKLPFATDSLLQIHYPKYYNVEIDDDIPYMAYLRSSQDYVQFIKKKRGGFYIETATIRDTVLNVLGEVKVGMARPDVFTALGLPLDVTSKEDFSLILCHADLPSKIWYKKDINLKKAIAREQPTTQVYLNFEGGILKLAHINSWIGYGDKGEVKF